MRICPYCHKQIEDDALFCTHCGREAADYPIPCHHKPEQKSAAKKLKSPNKPITGYLVMGIVFGTLLAVITCGLLIVLVNLLSM